RAGTLSPRASPLVPLPVPGEGVSYARLDRHLGHEAGQLAEPRDVGTAPRHRALGCRHAVEDGRDAGLAEHETGQVLDHRLLAIVADVDDLSPRRLGRRQAQDRLHGVRHVAEGAPLLGAVEPEWILPAQSPEGQLGDHVVYTHARPVHVVEAPGDGTEAAGPGGVYHRGLAE